MMPTDLCWKDRWNPSAPACDRAATHSGPPTSQYDLTRRWRACEEHRMPGDVPLQSVSTPAGRAAGGTMNVQGFQAEPLSRDEFAVIARRRDMRGVSAIERRRLIATVHQLHAELLAVAKLAAGTPQFFNPLEPFAAAEIRDRVLAEDRATRSGLDPKGGAE